MARSKSHHYNPSKSFTSETVGDGAIMFDLKYLTPQWRPPAPLVTSLAASARGCMPPRERHDGQMKPLKPTPRQPLPKYPEYPVP